MFKGMLAGKHVVHHVNCQLILSEFNNIRILIIFLNVFCGKHIFITLLEGGTLDIQEWNRRNKFFSLGTGHELIFELAEEQEEEELISVQRFLIC
jgi:hypothetical protein